MIKKIIFGLATMMFVSACSNKFVEGEEEKYVAENREQILEYIEANNLTLTENTSTGIFWGIEEEMSDAEYPNAEKTIHLAYTMKSLSGAELIKKEAKDSVFFNNASAANVFSGFVIAVNALREGEKGVFYIPSAYAYGKYPPSDFAIAPWEVLVLELESIKHYTETDLIERYLTNKGISDYEVTDLGVYIIRKGDRPESEDLVSGDDVNVSYKGYFFNGESFDEGSLDYILGSNTLIPGFADGIDHMRVGEQATVIIPWLQGYGESGNSGIPGMSTLIFDIEIVSKN